MTTASSIPGQRKAQLNLQQIGTDGRLFQGDLMDEVIVEMIVMAMPNIMTTMPNSGTRRPDV
jgi:hypothetical protein